jgi:hypothetical protein
MSRLRIGHSEISDELYNRPYLHALEFDSGYDLCQFLQNGDGKESLAGTREEYRGQRKWAFGSLESEKATLEQISQGKVSSKRYQSELTKIKKELNVECAEQFSGEAKSAKRRRRIRDVGDEVDIDRWMSGVPEHWSRMERGAKRRKVRFGINVALSHGNAEKNFLKVVALGALTAEALERRGHAVEVYACAVAERIFRNSHQGASLIFPVKRAQERFDLQRIGSLHAPGLLRFISFACMDYVASINEDIGTVDDGKGNCVPVEEDTMKFLGLDYMVELKHTEDAQEFMSQVLNNK